MGVVELGKQTHCCCLKAGFDTHDHVRNTLIHMYGMFKDVKAATYLFDEIPSSGLVAWNTIIDCYVECGMYKEALELFLKMEGRGIEPDDATFVVVLSACSSLGELDFGKWVHSRISCSGLDENVAVSASLIDMYAKCGEIEKAHLVFSNMKMRNLVSWNSMILGLAMHGYAEQALELFGQMQEMKIEVPNDVTFLGVLCACSHRGLVDEGKKYFDSMTRDYGIQPTMKHYGCMVDLLGRAGLVEEAYEVIMSMPIECNAIVWRVLLGACRVHGNLELGERVRRHIAQLQVDHSGDYVLLSHMYANEGRWNDAFRTRQAMRGRQVQKPKPGNSLVDPQPSMMMMQESSKPCDEIITKSRTA
ncbi:hypothetical protein IFM89_017794 [Coptis chinensis]|uniref:Pentatricopeptide repeat-containing protein n=1 Tax=Coptis chinensis TaxID=261450 RepID=A0A835H4N4_9MAGN|nr:hypothetical protein IFM89_017794 [Coptis chinensis]